VAGIYIHIILQTSLPLLRLSFHDFDAEKRRDGCALVREINCEKARLKMRLSKRFILAEAHHRY
jgi:hypothetical protein